MEPLTNFAKGFGLGVARLVANRLVFAGARVVGIFGFLALIAWQPQVFGHPYAPIVGVFVVIMGGLAYRAARSTHRGTGDNAKRGWRSLASGD